MKLPEGSSKSGTLSLGHPAVKRVYYPGLPGHPNHEVARAASMVSAAWCRSIRTNLADVHASRSVRLFALAESLGGVESLIDHPVSMTHASMDSALRQEAGIGESLIRLSVGIEDIDDILEDMGNALSAVTHGANG